MFNFVYKAFPRLKHSIETSPTQKVHFYQLNLLSTVIKRDSKADRASFTVSYLVNTCGFDPEKAVSASKYVGFSEPYKPNAVLSFLQKHGFTKPQITSLIRRFPPVILCDPEKTLLPKIEFFESKGFEKEDINMILSRTPNIFKRSLEKQIIPSFDLFSSLINSHDNTVNGLKRFAYILCCDMHTSVLPNVEVLREVGVPDSNIAVLLTYQPRDMTMDNAKFRLVVEDVKEMGFDPSLLKFLIAIHAIRSMSKLTWEKKVEAYKKWGWSEDEIFVAFGKHPWCMMVSVDKIMKAMDIFVNKMGYKSSVVLKRPPLISLSLNKRIIPRCLVYQILTAKGLVGKAPSLSTLLESPEKKFLKKFVEAYAEEAPELLKIYEKKDGSFRLI